MADWRIVLLVSTQIVTAMAYFGIAVWVVPKLRTLRWTRGTLVMIIAAVFFFVTCAYTHFELGAHAWENPAEWMLTGHMLVSHTFQALAAPVFLWAAARFATISIGSRAAAVELKEAG